MKENISVMNKRNFLGTVCLAAVVAVSVASCGEKFSRKPSYEFARNMYDPIGYNPDQLNPNFADGLTAQTPPEGTTPIGFERFEYANTPEDYELSGLEAFNPLEITNQTLSEGEALFQAYCVVCHGPEGRGDGPITLDRELVTKSGTRALENFPPPPSYALSDDANASRGGKMGELPDGKIYHAITYGVGLMGSHASQLSPEERWKVVAYVKELQKN